jgi:hypothetical protein
MAQLSRPYQFGLLAVALLAGVWLVLLQGHSSSTTSTGSSASVPAVQTVTASTPAPKHAAGKPASTYHGSAPGVAGLTRAIAKAQGAVATSQRSAKALEEKSARASNEHPAAASPSTAPAKAVTTTPASPATKPAPVAPSRSAAPKAAPNVATRSTIAANQRVVEAQLAQGKIAVILFWDPKGADDVSVRGAVAQLRGQSGLRIGVSVARASQVASFGTITRGVQVYGTPTLLIVNKKGQTTTLTGLQDAYAIKQAIQEARHS